MWSVMWSLLGLVVSIITYPRYVYTPTSTAGLVPNPPDEYIPFSLPGLAIPIKKGRETSEKLSILLLSHSCTSMSFQGRTVWLLDNGTKELILLLSPFEEIDAIGASPERYLNIDSFRSLLTLLSITTRICSFFRVLASSTRAKPNQRTQSEGSKLLGDWKTVQEFEANEDDSPVPSKATPEFVKKGLFRLGAWENKMEAFLLTPGSEDGLSSTNSGVVYNNLATIPTSYIDSGDSARITQSGYIFKYSEQLAKPDINLIGDILGRHFLLLLGATMAEQFENLAMLKRGLGTLRLTAIGSELTHLYKSIEIAIHSNSGLIPFFTGSLYEGSIMAGGPDNLSLLISGEIHAPSDVTKLKQSFLTISDHTAALNFILELLFPDPTKRAEVEIPTNMFDLRGLCLVSRLTPDEIDSITRRAALLDFKPKSWSITTESLKNFASLITGTLDPSGGIPIGRTALFSRDILYVAMSCFGETRCPSWLTPNGTPCSWSRPNPPVPQLKVRNQSVKQGAVSDAPWSMTIRKTRLPDAVDDFRRMAETMMYRSVASVEAKKSGYIVVGRDRMGVFWNDMRGALKSINPSAKLEGETVTGVKRAAEGSPDTVGNSPPGGVAGKRLRF